MNAAPPPRPPHTGDTPGRSHGLSRHTSPASPAAAGAATTTPVPRRVPYAPADMLSSMAHLTARDLLLADWLAEHGVLTTAQITTALFASATTASHRLITLHRIRLLDRFHRPHPGGGFGPWHWVIGPLGAQLHAAAHDLRPPTPWQLTQRHARLAASAYLPHRLGTNDFFIDLYAHARRHDDTALLRWWSERDTARRYHQRIHPDGHGLWRADATTIGLFLEYDTGSENLPRLLRKLDAYDQLAADGGPAYPVLFWLPSRRREQNLHELLTEAGRPWRMSVATGVHGRPGPAAPVWSLDGNTRMTLTDIAFDHGDPDSMYNPNLHDPELDQHL
jgi:hypothetical protein